MRTSTSRTRATDKRMAASTIGYYPRRGVRGPIRRQLLMRHAFYLLGPPEFYHDVGNVVQFRRIPAISASSNIRGRDDQQKSFPSFGGAGRGGVARHRIDGVGAGWFGVSGAC